MILHVLPGDSYVETFRETGIFGDVAVCRECLIEGPVNAQNLEEFWKMRASYLDEVYGDEGFYFDNVVGVVSELTKMQHLPPDAEVNLWFEHELFCQVNMWFCLSLLGETKARVYRIEPYVTSDADIWRGFRNTSSDELLSCFLARRQLSLDDTKLGRNLWKAYQFNDNAELQRLSQTKTDHFPFLERVCQAEIEKATLPVQILTDIKKTGITEFTEIFTEFSRRAGVYGFGDLQVKGMLELSK